MLPAHSSYASRYLAVNGGMAFKGVSTAYLLIDIVNLILSPRLRLVRAVGACFP
jgi:hypothetical protein